MLCQSSGCSSPLWPVARREQEAAVTAPILPKCTKSFTSHHPQSSELRQLCLGCGSRPALDFQPSQGNTVPGAELFRAQPQVL